MEQEEIREKVRELFEEQGFRVGERSEHHLEAFNDVEMDLKVFSSARFDAVDVVENVDEGDRVFVDEGLRDVEERIGNSVSVIEDESEEPGYDLPSYEIIGDIAVINDLAGRDEEKSVEGILHHHPFVKTVLLKEEPLSGEFRVGDYRKLYGSETETVHKEFGLEYLVDPTRVYFSERFGTERKRVVDQIEDGEKVLVVGAGVGPFAILAAREKDVEVVGVEKNPVAAEYFRENVERNNVEASVEVVEGDVRDVDISAKFDRAIIPIPEFSGDLLEASVEKMRDGWIHFYCFGEDIMDVERTVSSLFEYLGLDYNVEDVVECGDRGPRTGRYCADIHIKQDSGES